MSDIDIPPPKSRNDRCPCGSGKRYKHCHGAPALATTPRSGEASPAEPNATYATTDLPRLMDAALAAQRADDLDAAADLYAAALALAPGEPDCLHMLGVVRLYQHRRAEALALIERAGRSTGW
ncbi:MAG: SEC-C domain-containing protein [Proteobacteria bacterium]|nr:SEC-C domain-containing protein [Pseudomonadota bacterium]